MVCSDGATRGASLCLSEVDVHTLSICNLIFVSELLPPKTAPFKVNDTDEPDDTSFRALRPKTFRGLTLDVITKRGS